MATVTQPSINPTNKLTAAVAASAAISVARVIIRHSYPDWADDAMWDALLPIAILVFGYVIKDAPNT